MVRDADLQEVRNSISEIRNFDFKGTVERAVDPDGSLRATMATNPLAPDPVIRAPAPVPSPMLGETAVAELDRPPPPIPHLPPELAREPGEAADAEPAPWFIPPAFAAKPDPAPAFVPPTAKRPPRA